MLFTKYINSNKFSSFFYNKNIIFFIIYKYNNKIVYIYIGSETLIFDQLFSVPTLIFYHAIDI